MKIICIGVNYKAHAIEMGRAFPEKPVVFLKPDSAIIRNNKPFFIPGFSSNLHYEAEIVLRICKVGRSVAERFAHRYYDMITLGVDMTARDLQAQQSKAGMPWEIAKGFDGSAPLGRFIHKDELGDMNNISFSLLKNDVTVQEANSSDLIFSFDSIISYVSLFFTLKTGDLIFTGTPSGVGQVHPGDRLTGILAGNQV
ncbi:MAG: FAA hydrolase family protein, partial [Bacteroidia bacterium]